MTLWVTLETEHFMKLNNVHWMLRHLNTLLRIQQAGDYQLSEEGYLINQHRINGFDRAITMSAWAGLSEEVGGVLGAKWVSSCLTNAPRKLPRGESITVLNCGQTGLPLLAFDGTDLSNARTAAFAVAALERLFDGAHPPRTVAFLGAGRVHKWQAKYLRQLWPRVELWVYDPNLYRKNVFDGRDLHTWEQACAADVISIATAGAEEEWIPTDTPFTSVVWINTSLRDITKEMVGRFPLVIVDDNKLAASQNTPYHKAQMEGLVQDYQQLCDVTSPPLSSRPILVNPMGMGLWDVGLGYYLLQEEYRAQKQRLLAGERL